MSGSFRPAASCVTGAGAVVGAAPERASRSAGVPAALAQPCCRGPAAIQTINAPMETTLPAMPRRRSGGEPGPGVRKAPNQRGNNGRHADGDQTHRPERLGVRPRSQAVDHADRPARVREEVHSPPRPPAEPVPYETRRGDRNQQLESDHPEAEPHGTVRRDEGHERVEEIELREWVDDRREDVNDEKQANQQ